MVKKWEATENAVVLDCTGSLGHEGMRGWAEGNCLEFAEISCNVQICILRLVPSAKSAGCLVIGRTVCANTYRVHGRCCTLSDGSGRRWWM